MPKLLPVRMLTRRGMQDGKCRPEYKWIDSPLRRAVRPAYLTVPNRTWSTAVAVRRRLP